MSTDKKQLYSTSDILLFFLKNSPVWLLFSLTVGFFITGTFLFSYYHNYLLKPFFSNSYLIAISLMAALMFQLLRFSFALSGSADHATGNKVGKYWGFGFSGFITLWELIELYQAVLIMTGTTDLDKFFNSLYMFVFAITLFPFLAEIRLTLQLANSLKIKELESKITDENGNIGFLKLGEEKRIEYLRIVYFQYLEDHGRKPSLRALSDLVGSSTTTINKYISQITNY